MREETGIPRESSMDSRMKSSVSVGRSIAGGDWSSIGDDEGKIEGIEETLIENFWGEVPQWRRTGLRSWKKKVDRFIYFEKTLRFRAVGVVFSKFCHFWLLLQLPP